MTKLELKSSHEVIYTVDVADVDSIFHGKPIDPDILTVVMKDGKRLYCDEVCPIDALKEEPVSEDLENAAIKYAQDKYMPVQTSQAFKAGAEWGKNQAEIQIKAQSMALAHGCPKESVSEELEKAAREHSNNLDNISGSIGEMVRNAYKAGAKWQKENLWKPADGDDLPEYEREVVVFTDDAGMMRVAIGHRPNPDGFDGKSLSTGKVEHYTPKTYGKGGWNIPNIKYWLDCLMPKEIEL